jgi:diacylglycerol kinase family enzyme
MRVAVVINASAGSLLGREKAAEEVAEHLEAAGLDAAIEHDDGRGLVERISAAARSGAQAVVVGGGDGTIACAAAHLAGTDTALGILPLGTMNLLAKDLRLPLNLTEAADALAHGTIRAIDVGDVNGHTFLINSVLGMPSRLAVTREKKRGVMALGDYYRFAVSGMRSLTRYPPLHVALDLGGDGRRRLRTRALAVVDNDYDEGFGQIFSRSRLDGGELVVYALRGLNVWRIVRFAFGMAFGNWRSTPGLERHVARHLVIHSRRKQLRVMNDGEVVLIRPPLRYRIRPRALKVIVPEAAADKAQPEAPAVPIDAAL